MSTSVEQADIPTTDPIGQTTQPATEQMAASAFDPEPENWLSRGIGIFLGLAVSAAAVGGVVGLLHMGGRH